MRRLTLILGLALLSVGVKAQQYMRVWQGAESQRIALTEAGTMSFAPGNLQIAGVTYPITQVDSITLVKTVSVEWTGNQASVSVPETAQKDLTVRVDGGHVSITNANVHEEMEFILSGESTNGSLTYNGAYKCKFHLNGLNLTSQTGAALDIQCGKRIDLILAGGTQNVLSDGKGGMQKAALYCKGHLEIQGPGNLTVSGNTKHALSSKEYLLLKKSTGTLKIAAAASDALHVGQYFQMNGGTVLIDENTLGDGIQVDATEDVNDELNGQVIIKGGTIQATIAHEDCKGIKNEGSELGTVPCGDLTITGGNITIQATGNGSRGIQTDANMLIADTDGPTTITITAAGGQCTKSACSADPHRCMGIKVDGNLNVTGGTTNVENTGKKSRGIKVGGTYNKTGGVVNATVA